MTVKFKGPAPKKIKLDPVLKEMFLQRLRSEEGYHLGKGQLVSIDSKGNPSFCALGLLADTAGLWSDTEYYNQDDTYSEIADLIGTDNLTRLFAVNDIDPIFSLNIASSAVLHRRRSRVIKWVKENL